MPRPAQTGIAALLLLLAVWFLGSRQPPLRAPPTEATAPAVASVVVRVDDQFSAAMTQAIREQVRAAEQIRQEQRAEAEARQQQRRQEHEASLREAAHRLQYNRRRHGSAQVLIIQNPSGVSVPISMECHQANVGGTSQTQLTVPAHASSTVRPPAGFAGNFVYGDSCAFAYRGEPIFHHRF